MRSPLKTLIAVLTSISLALILPAAFVIYIDPFQIFHKSNFPEMGMPSNQRYQNAGLINSYLTDANEGYDSVMIGTSLSENFTTQTAAEALGWQKPLRLFLDGGDPKELFLTLAHALHTPC